MEIVLDHDYIGKVIIEQKNLMEALGFYFNLYDGVTGELHYQTDLTKR